MAESVPQDILDALTNVPLPELERTLKPGGRIEVAGNQLSYFQAGTVIVGSGAAGLRAAIELKRLGEDVLVITSQAHGGTSACSGSDKQTLHTAGTSNRGDDFSKLAQDLGAGGCMDGDSAYIEAVGSIAALGGLQYLGLPLPTDRFGAVLRYQTDHDQVGRATSCGPRTSRLMVKVLAEEALRLGVEFLSGLEAVRLLSHDGQVVGLLAIDLSASAKRDRGLRLVLAGSVVLAGGGPGEIYRDSVYPHGCHGVLGLAAEAGLELVNLTESQFGIGTRREEFPWNLSGTYAQVLPAVYSVGPDGQERNFLGDYYRTTRELASNIFRKGYQWPFHARRMTGFGSSLFDLAVYRETSAGRTVYMDFRRNPDPVPGGAPFDLADLDDDARRYLENNHGLGATPIERLRSMNPLSIELYRMNGTDLATAPLPFAVNNQHHNGGIAIDSSFRTSLRGCYAIGEAAGSHGVTRPGGAALNAGQVGGIRCAAHIHHQHRSAPAPTLDGPLIAQIAEVMTLVKRLPKGGIPLDDVRREIRQRMSDTAGFLVQTETVGPALAAARQLRTRVDSEGFRLGENEDLIDALRWRHHCLASEAILTALNHYVTQGGGSRGARALLGANGTWEIDTRLGKLDGMRIIPERESDRKLKLVLRWTGTAFTLSEQPLRTIEDLGRIFFERNWASYLTGRIHTDGFRHE